MPRPMQITRMMGPGGETRNKVPNIEEAGDSNKPLLDRGAYQCPE